MLLLRLSSCTSAVGEYGAIGFDSQVITGHIDFLQIRNGHIHILDYKPEAGKETHAHVQLTIYALALARRIGLPLKVFKCSWFDEKDYFEFYPLQGVYALSATSSPTRSLSLHGDVNRMKRESESP